MQWESVQCRDPATSHRCQAQCPVTATSLVLQHSPNHTTAHHSSAVQIFKILDPIEQLVTIRFHPEPIKQLEIFEYLFKRNIYKEGTVYQ